MMSGGRFRPGAAAVVTAPIDRWRLRVTFRRLHRTGVARQRDVAALTGTVTPDKRPRCTSLATERRTCTARRGAGRARPVDLRDCRRVRRLVGERPYKPAGGVRCTRRDRAACGPALRSVPGRGARLHFDRLGRARRRTRPDGYALQNLRGGRMLLCPRACARAAFARAAFGASAGPPLCRRTAPR